MQQRNAVVFAAPGDHTAARRDGFEKGPQHVFFRVTVKIQRHQFNRVSPGGPDVAALTALIRGYVGDGMRWDLRLRLLPEAVPTLQLGSAIIGQTSWLWSTGEEPQDDLIFDPMGLL